MLIKILYIFHARAETFTGNINNVRHVMSTLHHHHADDTQDGRSVPIYAEE